MDCGDHCIKYILFFFNFIFVLCGLALLIPGIIINSSYAELAEIKNELMSQGLNVPSTPLIIVGGIIFVIAFFGCCGAIRESHCMIVTYAVLLLTVLIIQIAIGVLAFLSTKNVDQNIIKSKYEQTFQHYWTEEKDKKFVDIIQSSLECCGVEGRNDFINRPGFNSTIPWSCCPQKNPDHKQFCTGHNDIYEQGCAPAIASNIKNAVQMLGGIAIGIAVVEFIGIIFALCLANSIKNSERRAYRV